MDKKDVKSTKTVEEQKPVQDSEDHSHDRATRLPPNLVGAIADEVAKTLMERIPSMVVPRRRRIKKKAKKAKEIENAYFLDTSAIIDGRIFDIVTLKFLNGVIVIPESILLELKHIADSQDMVKRGRGRSGLEDLEKLKKEKKMKIVVLPPDQEKVVADTVKEVDEKLMKLAKTYKGKIITCDYNLEKKASIAGINVININALANALKVVAVPGEALHIKLQHVGKDMTQGVGYLDDGTMIVVERGRDDVGNSIDVVVSRVIQTATGRILFAKKI
jgi:uncharacterized protein YacL